MSKRSLPAATSRVDYYLLEYIERDQFQYPLVVGELHEDDSINVQRKFIQDMVHDSVKSTLGYMLNAMIKEKISTRNFYDRAKILLDKKRPEYGERVFFTELFNDLKELSFVRESPEAEAAEADEDLKRLVKKCRALVDFLWKK